jgi:hypothetical protein
MNGATPLFIRARSQDGVRKPIGAEVKGGEASRSRREGIGAKRRPLTE